MGQFTDQAREPTEGTSGLSRNVYNLRQRMLHLVPALLILWLNGTLADRPASSVVRAALLDLHAGSSSKAESLRVLEAWLGQQVSEEVLQRIGAWLETPWLSSPGTGPLHIQFGRCLDRPVTPVDGEAQDPGKGVARFRDGPKSAI
jgi:hypothetical protein